MSPGRAEKSGTLKKGGASGRERRGGKKGKNTFPPLSPFSLAGHKGAEKRRKKGEKLSGRNGKGKGEREKKKKIGVLSSPSFSIPILLTRREKKGKEGGKGKRIKKKRKLPKLGYHVF